jgi:hypothetical protein
MKGLVCKILVMCKIAEVEVEVATKQARRVYFCGFFFIYFT